MTDRLREMFEKQQDSTKQMVHEYNDTLAELGEQIKALFILDAPTHKDLYAVNEGLNELKKGDFKTLFKYLDSIKESYSIENELFRQMSGE